MSFSSLSFIFIFLPIFLIMYRIFPPKCQKFLLTFGGLVFYAIGQKWLVLALLASLLINYGLHFWISKVRVKTPLLAFSIVLNSGLLIACKILGFLPLGISFYTFQVISMQVDCRKRTVRFGDFGALLCCFPKLAMGPIARMPDWWGTLKRSEKKHLMTPEGMDAGLRLFTVGLAFKVILADNIATLWSSIRVSGAWGITTSVAWLGAIAYTIELYFDFFGYSLMAVGLGKMLGIPVPENFNEPYSSRTIGEFWRRWNLTLGEWFKSYIYIPLGGNRKGKFRTVINLFVVWFVTGVWHGWGLNFAIWAGVLFFFIMLERITPLGKLSKVPIIGNAYVILIIPVTWVIFSIDNVSELLVYLKCMIGIYDENAIPAAGQFMNYLGTYWYLILAGIIFMTPLPRYLSEKFGKKHYIIAPLLGLLILALYFINHGQGSGFLYYNF